MEGNFPFYWVQIAPFNYGPTAKSYVVRAAQLKTLSVPNTGMAVTLDIGTVNNIHPPDKQDVGHRLALWALDKTYGERLFYSGPLYRSMSVKGNKAIVSFKYADGGLVYKPLNGSSNFIIAGKDSNFFEAEVKVVGKTLVVYSQNVRHPVAVRYAWGNTEEATLFNKAGLPASTFRTDDWPQ
jgi:sialate O-acetylesterase